MTNNATDKMEQALDILVECANGLEAVALGVKQRVAELKQPATIGETVFDTLTWQQKKGAKLNEFEVATKDTNASEKFQHTVDILKANNASINDRFYEPEYLHSYWIYQDTIYRQKRKATP